MNSKLFTLGLIAFAIVTSVVASTATALLTDAKLLLTNVYVRRDEAVAPNATFPIIFAGTYNLTAGSNPLVVQVDDRRTTGSDTRLGRTSADVLILVTTTSPVSSNVVIEASGSKTAP
jgi:hypothetical protein